jgi:hypothetical protein
MIPTPQTVDPRTTVRFNHLLPVHLLCLTYALIFALLRPTATRAQSEPDYERAPIYYSATTPNNAVTRLQAHLAHGEVKLAGTELAMLGSVLSELGVSPESQMLVFSRTSFQRTRIHPDQPRALYFSDSVYVGWVPGGLVEVTAIDPQLGPVFYTLTLPGPQQTTPKIERESDCLRCHGGVFVREIPGLFVRSVFPDAAGDPLLRHGTQIVDDETPFAERWGGWYVTGYHGTASHRGNALASEQGDILRFKPSAARPKELSAFFDTTRYLRPTSDMIALLICEHQMSVQNSLTHAAFAVRRIINYQHGLQTAFHEPQTDEPAYDSVRSVFAGAVQDVVDHLLFRQAAPLPAGIIADPAFVAGFAPNAPRSHAGHALSDLQLNERIFAQRCSFLIYSESFRTLPPGLKSQIFARLKTALASRDPADRYAYLPAEEKERIWCILEQTLPDFSATKIFPALAAR